MTHRVHLATSSKHGICPRNHGRMVMRVDGDEVMEEKAVTTQHASCHHDTFTSLRTDSKMTKLIHSS